MGELKIMYNLIDSRELLRRLKEDGVIVPKKNRICNSNSSDRDTEDDEAVGGDMEVSKWWTVLLR